jgi:hypothetical protein
LSLLESSSSFRHHHNLVLDSTYKWKHAFLSWPISFNVMTSSSTHFSANDIISFFMAE